MTDPLLIALVAATFLLAGTVKGVIGLGLPTLSLALLSIATDLTQAMALLVVPSLATNLWQACAGGNGRGLIKRLWPFLTMAGLTVWLGALALPRVDLAWLSGLLGVLLIAYGGVSLTGVRFSIPRPRESWAGPLTGAVNGVLTGMTGSFVVPGVMYLQAIGLSRDALVQAMGMLFTVSTLALALSLYGHGLMTAERSVLSAAALIPALAGMAAGQWVRGRLTEATFRRVFFVSLVALGLYILAGALAAVA
jgi:uncharacterized membrane protein YfcA